LRLHHYHHLDERRQQRFHHSSAGRLQVGGLPAQIIVLLWAFLPGLYLNITTLYLHVQYCIICQIYKI
jgi:hypothetical protein